VSLVQHAPKFDIESVASIVEVLYGLRVSATSLPSERDQNFLLTEESGQRFVFKIANTLEDESLLMAQSEAMAHITGRVSFCQQLVPSINGNILERVDASTDRTNLVRLSTYLPGLPLGDRELRSPVLLRDLGNKLGQIDSILMDFDRPAIHRGFHWDLAKWRAVLTQHEGLISDAQLRSLIQQFSEAFEHTVAPFLSQLRRSCIHGDANDYNILVNEEGSEVLGIIDFGDMVYSYTVGDLAIAMAYVVLNNDAPLAAAQQIVAGYHEALPLLDEEIEIVWELMLMRLCMSVCLAAYQQQQRPDNQYLDISQRAIRGSLPELLAIDRREVKDTLQVVI
jgi:Ser/Thr protein kinase RdoA (MazF antagonist)